MKFLILISTLALLFSSHFAWSLQIPNQLSYRSEIEILKNMGPATASRLLSSPYPLGGYEGLEIGLSRQYIPLDVLAHVGGPEGNPSELAYPVLSIGKGLFANIDMHLSLIPLIQSASLSHFSTQIRAQHWQSQSSPFILSSFWHAGYTTIKNQINFQNYGFDVVGTIILPSICLYFGVGTLFTNGRFIGGEEGITLSKDTDVVTSTFAHRVLGIDYRFKQYFLAFETDSYEKSFYAFKVGYRF